MSKVFLDTNVLAYACDGDCGEKQSVARAIISSLSADSTPCISTQVLQEFYVTATRKLGIGPLDAKDIIQSFRHMEVVTVDPEDIDEAIDGNVLWQVSFWDALIIVAARKACCEILLTEDLNHSQVYEGVQASNPFLGM